MLDDLGLAAAVDWLLRGLARRHDVHVNLVQFGMAGRLPAEVEVAAFRIVQEAVTNVARHARAARCTVRLTVEGPRLFVDVEDDGVGFGPIVVADTGTRRGLGLLGMRERAAALGGSVAVDSAPRRGTRVSVTLPLWPDGDLETSLPDGAGVGLAPA
jgi:signal transduction histidine kinase